MRNSQLNSQKQRKQAIQRKYDYQSVPTIQLVEPLKHRLMKCIAMQKLRKVQQRNTRCLIT